ncbi:MAG: Ribonuclease [Actinomycetota bacterium]
MIQRIQSRSAFTRIRSEGVHLRSGVLSCTMILDPSLPGPQVGYAFSRKFGSAVRRNRIRRQLRELVKIRETQFPAGVFVFGASPRASQTPIEILARDLDGLLAKVAR